MINTVRNNHFKANAFTLGDEAIRLILHNIRESYVLLNRQLSVVYFNKSAKDGIRRFLGMDIYPGLSIMELTRKERRSLVEEVCSEVLNGKTHFTESNFDLPDGSKIVFKNTFSPAFAENGDIVGVIVSSKDITETKEAQKQIHESEERLQFALEAAHQGAWDWNLETNEVTYSASYKKLYGFADNELRNHVSEWITRIHPEDQKKMRESVAEHLQAEDPVYESRYRIRDNNGRYRWVMAKGCIIAHRADGRPLRMIGTHTDITANVEKEAALKRINERFDCVMKATHDLIWEWDVENDQVIRSKESVKNVYGVKNEGRLRTFVDWLRRIHPEDRRAVHQTLQEVLKAPHHYTFEIEYRFRRDDGAYAFIYDRGILLRDEQGQPARIIGSAQDISERKRLEIELLEKELGYQRAIHQATVETQEKERAEIGKELHDNVNQVLTTTKLYLDLITANPELSEELLEKSRQNINNIIREIRHLSHSLMDPSIDDLGLIDSIKNLIENIQLTQQIKIEFVSAKDVDAVLDPAQKLAVFRIAQEALNNVLRHANATTALVSLTLHKEQVRMTIRDNGVGFTPETVVHGAGLKNIQNRINLIYGTLRLVSEPGNGCTIQIQFPIKK